MILRFDRQSESTPTRPGSQKGRRRLPPPRSTRDRATLLFFGVLVVYLLTASYTTQSVDTASMYYPAWQLAQHGNITMDAFADRPLWFVEAEGRLVPSRFPGAIWLATPLYLLDHSPAPSAGLANLAAAAATAGAVVVLYLLSRRLVSEKAALATSLIVAFATPTWTVSGDALWTHGPGQLWLLLGVLLAVQGRAFGSGLAFGAALLTRPHYAVIPAVVGVVDAVRTRRVATMVKIGLGSFAGLMLLLVYNRQVFGAWGVRTGYSADTSQVTGVGLLPFLENLAGTVLSPSRGILVMTPFLCLLLPGLKAAWRSSPVWVRAAAGSGILYMLSQLWLIHWSGGYAFYSYRFALESLTLSAPLLAVAYQQWTSRTKTRRMLFLGLVCYSAAVHAIGATAYHAEGAEPAYWRLYQPVVVFADRPGMASASGAAAVALTLLFAAILRSHRPAQPSCAA